MGVVPDATLRVSGFVKLTSVVMNAELDVPVVVMMVPAMSLMPRPPAPWPVTD